VEINGLRLLNQGMLNDKRIAHFSQQLSPYRSIQIIETNQHILTETTASWLIYFPLISPVKQIMTPLA
jgi:hypothetical protein